MKAACAAAALPVIDTRAGDFIAAARVTIGGPMVAVDCSPGSGTLARAHLRTA